MCMKGTPFRSWRELSYIHLFNIDAVFNTYLQQVRCSCINGDTFPVVLQFWFSSAEESSFVRTTISGIERDACVVVENRVRLV